MTTSVRSSTTGSGTSLTCMSCLPCHVTAFMKAVTSWVRRAEWSCRASAPDGPFHARACERPRVHGGRARGERRERRRTPTQEVAVPADEEPTDEERADRIADLATS